METHDFFLFLLIILLTERVFAEPVGSRDRYMIVIFE